MVILQSEEIITSYMVAFHCPDIISAHETFIMTRLRLCSAINTSAIVQRLCVECINDHPRDMLPLVN